MSSIRDSDGNSYIKHMYSSYESHYNIYIYIYIYMYVHLRPPGRLHNQAWLKVNVGRKRQMKKTLTSCDRVLPDMSMAPKLVASPMSTKDEHGGGNVVSKFHT